MSKLCRLQVAMYLVDLLYPCSRASNGLISLRTKSNPDGLDGCQLSERERQILNIANAVTTRAFALAELADDCGCMVSVENPAGSLIWHTPAFHAWKTKADAQKYRFDMCRYGTPYKKPTVIYASRPLLLSSICRLCNHRKQHVKLSGWRTSEDQVLMPTRNGSSNYPVRLTNLWAKAIAEHFQDEMQI